MNKTLRFLAPLGLALAISSCSAGPHQLARSVDDWDHKNYVESPIMNGVLHFIPVIPLVSFFAIVGDFFTGDAYSFWFKDAWDGKGTGFEHAHVEWTDGRMPSLWRERTGWTRIEK
jgi:hypothetical protein